MAKPPYTRGADQASAVLAILGGAVFAGLGLLAARAVRDQRVLAERLNDDAAARSDS